MDEHLQRLRRWMGRATMRQFYTELQAHLPTDEYELELEGDTLTVFHLEKRRGFLGLGARQVRRPCLQVIHHSDRIEVPEECADPAFVALLAEMLRLR
jgi:hypothetical protein